MDWSATGMAKERNPCLLDTWPKSRKSYDDSVPSSSMKDPLARARDFRASMPASYRRAHGWVAIQEHAAIVDRRGEAVVHLEVWRVRRGTVAAIVSDDRTGGLAMMSAAIAGAGFDILVADAYRRVREGKPAEAVAFFELRRPSDAERRPITKDDLVPIGRELESLFLGETGPEGLLRRNAPTVPPGPQASPEVTFADDDEAAILLIEARDRPGLLAAITSALTEASARIVDSEIVTVDGRVRDRFQLTETDGAPLSESRRASIAQGVLAAVERGSS
jgi:[protein-PII] uridylyltransferase